MRKRTRPLALALSLAALSCGESHETVNEGSECSVSQERQYVYDAMRDYYLLADQLSEQNPHDYDSAEALLAAMRVHPDRFSYISDAEDYSAYFEEGRDFGFGFRLRIEEGSGAWRFVMIQPNSPMALAGVERGDTLLAVNGIAIDEHNAESLDAAFGSGRERITTRFTIETLAGEVQELAVMRDEYTVQSVQQHSVLRRGNHRIGYLNFSVFLQSSEAELEDAFRTFRAADVNELVLDLRYNGGGRVSVANQLASMIAGDIALGHDFFRRRYNDRYSEFNGSEPFLSVASELSLNLPRVFVLSSESTCSASELLINGLRPIIDVIQIGGTSCGKPYGTSADEFCGKQLSALLVSFENEAGLGDYWNGLAPDCRLAENYDQQLGQPEEVLLAGALSMIESGRCDSDPQLSYGPDALLKSRALAAEAKPDSLAELLDEML